MSEAVGKTCSNGTLHPHSPLLCRRNMEGDRSGDASDKGRCIFPDDSKSTTQKESTKKKNEPANKNTNIAATSNKIERTGSAVSRVLVADPVENPCGGCGSRCCNDSRARRSGRTGDNGGWCVRCCNDSCARRSYRHGGNSGWRVRFSRNGRWGSGSW